jgi:hypothetical protein
MAPPTSPKTPAVGTLRILSATLVYLIVFVTPTEASEVSGENIYVSTVDVTGGKCVDRPPIP